jgi:hypothetical protein
MCIRWKGVHGQEREVMPRAVWALLAAIVVVVPGHTGADDEKENGNRPEFTVRATPRFAFSPATILFTAELKGGDDLEEFYCPEIEWEWGDGGRSVSEGDCDPWEPGTEIVRRFTTRHQYRYAGRYRVRVVLSKAGKDIAADRVTVQVRPGIGETNRY